MSNRASPKLWSFWGMLSAALLFLSMVAPGAAGGVESQGACDQTQVIHDYGRVFKSMPSLHAPPLSGQLPFMGGHLYLVYPADEVLEGGKGDIALRYGVKRIGKHVPLPRNGAQLSATLSKVNRSGVLIGESVVQHRSLKLMVRAAADLKFAALTSGTLYRVDLKFESSSGVVLVRYGQYFRVLSPEPSADLNVYPTVISPGGEVQFRIENSGTTQLSYSRPYSVEKLSGGQWDPVTLSIGPWHLDIVRLSPGVAGACQGLKLPSDAEVGSYRIKKRLADPPRTLFGRFQVQH